MGADFANTKVCIIGLGLIGGSLAKALKERLGIRWICAVDRSTSALEQAIAERIVSVGYTSLEQDVFDCDIIFICTPVKQSEKILEALAGRTRPDCIISDVGSTKGELLDYVNSMQAPPCFIGGHPMAGSERAGYTASFPHLFENAYYILTPSRSSGEVCIERMTALVRGIGAIPVLLDAAEHDRVTGAISHLPHIIAFSLVNLVREQDGTEGKMQMLAAGGFRDITRIASSNPEMWESIVLSNQKQLLPLLDQYIRLLDKVKSFIGTEDKESLLRFFESAKSYRDSFPTGRKSLINPLYEIMVDVVDQPGIIGEIATLLGAQQINIKNINVSNSREFEQGALRITLPDAESVKAASELLTVNGYKVYKNM